MFYLRFLDLILNKIPTHPDFQSRSSYEILRQKVPGVLQQCEDLKNLIQQEIDEYKEARKQLKERGAEPAGHEVPSVIIETVEDEAVVDTEPLQAPAETYEAAKPGQTDLSQTPDEVLYPDNQDTVFKRNFSDMSTNTDPSVISNNVKQFASLNFNQVPNLNLDAPKKPSAVPINEPKIQLNPLFHKPSLDQEQYEYVDYDDDEVTEDNDSILVPDYPAIADEASLIKMYKQDKLQLTPRLEPQDNFGSPITISSPQKPPKIKSVEQIRSQNSFDSGPKELMVVSNSTSFIAPESGELATVKQDTLHRVEAFTEGGIPLKTVFVPVEIQAVFTQIAAENTAKDLETCGILCGKLVNNAFFITDLVIPDQASTANTCQTSGEENLLQFADDNDLFIIGWIHTHPTQSCFLSSVDLHTQNGYQIMLPESIAIVVAPKSNPNFGIFRLSDPYGINLITNCSKRGFHPHSEDGLYDICSKINGGHVVVRRNMPLEVTDIREQK